MRPGNSFLDINDGKAGGRGIETTPTFYRTNLNCHISLWQVHCDLLMLCREELWLARKDSDHYLRTMFSYLMDTLNPDTVIFLGDIFSDGFQASANQWHDYLTVRFNLAP